MERYGKYWRMVKYNTLSPKPLQVGSYNPSTLKRSDLKEFSYLGSNIVSQLYQAIKADSMALLPDGFHGGRSREDKELFVLYQS